MGQESPSIQRKAAMDSQIHGSRCVASVRAQGMNRKADAHPRQRNAPDYGVGLVVVFCVGVALGAAVGVAVGEMVSAGSTTSIWTPAASCAR